MNVGSKLRYLLIGAVVAVLTWAAAPALSARPYLPEPVDFEQRLSGVERVAEIAARAAVEAGEGTVTHRSPVIDAPRRFDLAGLAGELRPVELRGRESGGEWSDWVETANGDPVWFGGADELQLRTRGAWRPKGRLHYVNVTGTASPAETALTRFRQTVSSAFVTASGLLEGEAEALPTRPRVVSRNAWGATGAKGGCKPRSSPVRGRVKAAVVHHTVSANDYSAAEAPALVLGICRYHRNANGWNDIGYNALVDRFGTVYAGRAGGLKQAVVGAHAQGFNAQTSGVASIGTHSSATVTPAARRALVNFLAWKLASHGLPARGKATLVSAGGSASRYPSGRRVRLNRIIGHGRVGHTSCPGDRLDAQLGAIRRATQERIDSAGGAATPPTTTPPTVPDDGSGGLAH